MHLSILLFPSCSCHCPWASLCQTTLQPDKNLYFSLVNTLDKSSSDPIAGLKCQLAPIVCLFVSVDPFWISGVLWKLNACAADSRSLSCLLLQTSDKRPRTAGLKICSPPWREARTAGDRGGGGEIIHQSCAQRTSLASALTAGPCRAVVPRIMLAHCLRFSGQLSLFFEMSQSAIIYGLPERKKKRNRTTLRSTHFRNNLISVGMTSGGTTKTLGRVLWHRYYGV
jgi:hypothetical protein